MLLISSTNFGNCEKIIKAVPKCALSQHTCENISLLHIKK